MATNIGVIIGRFQVDDLHPAHRAVIDEVKSRHESVYIILGVPVIPLSVRYPLDFATRRRMIQSWYPDIEVLLIPDCKSNIEWQKNLDNIIRTAEPHARVTLYGGRDSFIKLYNGKFDTVELEIENSFSGTNGTEIRQRIGNRPLGSVDFRAGVIYSNLNRFPISYQTVDIALLTDDDEFILLGRKKGDTQWCFPGGFVDPSDKTLEGAANREIIEEAGAAVRDLKYVLSIRLTDWRYIHENDKLLTALFECRLLSHNISQFKDEFVIAGDDLEEVRWFKVAEFGSEPNTFGNQIITDTHRPLMCEFIKFLKERNRYHAIN